MAKVTHHGLAKPDDPIYKTGPVIGGIRFYGSPLKATSRAPRPIWEQAEQRQRDRMKALYAARGLQACLAIEAAYFDDLTSRRPDISKVEADELRRYRKDKPKEKGDG